MADCEACVEHVSPSSALVPPQSPAVPDMLTSLEVMSDTFPSLPDLLQVEDTEERVLAKREVSANSCNEGHALLDELLRDVNHSNPSPSNLFKCRPL